MVIVRVMFMMTMRHGIRIEVVVVMAAVVNRKL